MASRSDGARELKAEIEQAREQLGATIELLAAKADVKSRAQAKATELTSRTREHWVPLSLGATAVVLAYLAWHWRNR